MISCPSCGHSFSVSMQCPFPWCGRSDPHAMGPANCRVTGIYERVGSAWSGNFHIHLGGKAGELLFLSGCFPAVRAHLPYAKIVLHLHPHYAGIVAGLHNKPDAVICDPWYGKYPTAPLASQVTEGLRWAHASFGERTVVLVDEDNLHTGPYLCHRGSKPFYRLFLASLGLPDAVYTPPWWDRPEGPLVSTSHTVVLASANIHNGSHLRQLPLPPGEWSRLADMAHGSGSPIATGHQDDPQPEMPGWTWLDTNRPEDVFTLLRSSCRVVGLNSGMTFAATILSPGRVTMIDSQDRRMYDFGPMAAENVIHDWHRQIKLKDAEADWFKTIKEAIT